MYTLRFDGLYRNDWSISPTHQTGLMCYGWLVYRNGLVIARGHGGLLRAHCASSNTAEYLALIEGLSALNDLGIHDEKIQVIGDSKSVIEQMSGVASVNSPRVKNLHHKAVRLCRGFSSLHWLWEPRKRNHDADQLTRRALKQIRLGMSLGIRMVSSNRSSETLLDLRMFGPAKLSRIPA
jgi:ribonuclease HI